MLNPQYPFTFIKSTSEPVPAAPLTAPVLALSPLWSSATTFPIWVPVEASAVPVSAPAPVVSSVDLLAVRSGGKDQGEDQGGQTPIACPPQLVNFSFDTLHLSLDLVGISPDLLSFLKAEKENIQAGDDSQKPIRFKVLKDLPVFEWNLQRTGTAKFPYILRTADIALYLSTRSSGSQVPNAKLEIGSLSCHHDLIQFMSDLKFWLNINGIKVKEEKASRIDICADIQWNICVGGLDRIDRFITRARDHDIHGSSRRFNSIVWGGAGSNVMCRIYDKPLQMKQTNSIEKTVFFNNLWGTKIGTNVVRVEFQLRREMIVELFKGKTDVITMISRMSDVWEYLTNKWLRHTAKTVDRKNNNQKQAELSRFWQIVVSAGKSNKKKTLKRNKKQKFVDIVSLRKQAIGILTTVMASLGQVCDDFFGGIGTLTDIVSEDFLGVMREPDFQKKYKAKQLRAMASF